MITLYDMGKCPQFRKEVIFMADEKARFTLRIPQKLYDLVKESAEKNKRSVIKEIEYILENFFLNDSTTQKR